MHDSHKLSFEVSLGIIIAMMCIWSIIYPIFKFHCKCPQVLSFLLWTIVIALGAVTVVLSLYRLYKKWDNLSANNRMGIYNLCLKSIGLYSIFLVGCSEYSTSSYFYSLFIVTASITAISIIYNELDHYLS